MCILCVVQRWSRRVASMLPWLVVPLLVLWILSQLLPPGLRFEITSPRLACVLVLLVTLFWYEILMPKLSLWRARRSARLREQRRVRAIELQKLRRTATRRCRNCLTPYRDQNPGGGGRFMCSYCGHVSKRPVLDLPGWPDWSGDGGCLTEKSYSGAYRAACSVVLGVGFCVGWVIEKVFRVGNRDGGSDEGRGLSSKRGESGGNFQESRLEKARRKAEEKRQARLEREMLEEEERKQREEVARLVEERRKLRDEMLEAERGRSKVCPSQETGRKETERRKRERKRVEKDKGSSKSNSDGEEPERRTVSREGEKKREFDRKGEIERQKALVESLRSQVAEAAHGNKGMAVSKSRYFDRVKGSFFPSSRGFNSSSFFGRNAQTAATPASKANRPATGFGDHGQNSGVKRDMHAAGSVVGKSTVNGDTRPAGTDLQPRIPPPKKGWHQLFTRSSSVSPDPDTNSGNFVSLNGQLEATRANDLKVLPYPVDNGFSFGQPLPASAYSSPNGPLDGRLFSHVGAESAFLPFKEPVQSSTLEDTESFEDPCYVPDPVSLVGPVSESLDKFPLDLGTGFVQYKMPEGPRVLNKAVALPESSKPSPIESPLSKLRVSEEKQGSCTPTKQKLHSTNLNASSNEHTWQMWGTPLSQDRLGLSGGPSSWFSPLMHNREDVIHPLAQGPLISQIGIDNPLLPSIRTQKVCGNNHPHGGTFSPLGPALNGNDQWVRNSPFQPPVPVDGESHFLPLDLMDNIVRTEVAYGSPSSSAPIYPAEVLPTDGWSKEERALRAMKEAGNSTPVKPPNIGGLFSTSPDVQSVWSYDHQ
ncbi:stress response protein nst1-like isoform X1 [Iris pallida]|uniref:Stress response protein nst1-like isoform X1 n=1 Tax=Iris pallida TaxID=29817 RepID=A0AAX6HMG8_IRIPA|nr:stress response protein nst1-like isoform X1 [Iris pallida]